MRFWMFLMLVLSVLVVSGCGGGQAVIPESTTDSVTSLIKPILEKIAETGDHEAVSEVKSYIEEDLAGVDQAKSDALMKEWNEMNAMTNPAQIKEKAQAMLSML
jgi:hypothetical protein